MNAAKTLLLLLLLLAPTTIFTGCQTDPITGERMFNFYSLEGDIKIGQQVMQDFLDLSKKSGWLPEPSHPYYSNWKMEQDKCEEIMNKIIPNTHLGERVPWKIYYTLNPTPNAFALPGGQMMVFQGLLKKYNPEKGLVINYEELAAVVGHEMAHVNARHGTENMSKAIVANIALLAAAAGSSASGSGGDAVRAMNEMIKMLFPAFSREMEQEADTVGTMYIAMSGYNPKAALGIWERGARERPRGSSIYDSHPVDSQRAAYLNNLMPKAQDVYRRAMAGENFNSVEKRAEIFGYDRTPVIAKTKAGIPAGTVSAFKYKQGEVDSRNFWWDTKNRRLVIRVKNNTNREIEDFAILVVFFDYNGQEVCKKKIKINDDLNEGRYIDAAIPLPVGAQRAQWNIVDVNWD